MDCPLPYQIKDDYYIDVNDFTEDFIKFSNTLGIDAVSYTHLTLPTKA